MVPDCCKNCLESFYENSCATCRLPELIENGTVKPGSIKPKPQEEQEQINTNPQPCADCGNIVSSKTQLGYSHFRFGKVVCHSCEHKYQYGVI